VSGISRVITPTMNEALVSDVTEEEIHAALLKIHPNKAPGPDGMTSKVDELKVESSLIMPDGSDFFRNSPSQPDGVTIWQEITSRSELW
jgi:hypothetical protein